jgi:hypothetical protein
MVSLTFSHQPIVGFLTAHFTRGECPAGPGRVALVRPAVISFLRDELSIKACQVGDMKLLLIILFRFI